MDANLRQSPPFFPRMATTRTGYTLLCYCNNFCCTFQKFFLHSACQPQRPNQCRRGCANLANRQVRIFFPPLLMHFGQEQMAQRSDYQMTTERFIVTNLKMTQSEFTFFILKTPLHIPTRKADTKQHFQWCAFRGVGDKVFNFFGVFNIAGNNQPMCSSRQAITLKVGLGSFSLPEHRAFSCIFDMELLPRNLSQHRRMKQQLFYTTGRWVMG